HVVSVVKATRSLFSAVVCSRISKRFSPAAAAKRKRGRSQLRGKSVPTSGSTRHGPPLGSPEPAGPNNPGEPAGAGAAPVGPARYGVVGKSSYGPLGVASAPSPCASKGTNVSPTPESVARLSSPLPCAPPHAPAHAPATTPRTI